MIAGVNGWIIDYRTAAAIFGSGRNDRISHCVGLCEEGLLSATQSEEHDFKQSPVLGPVFTAPIKRIIVPDADILGRCAAIANLPLNPPLLSGNNSAIFIAATAASRNLGVISDHRNTRFATVSDICRAYCLPVYTFEEYYLAQP
jgi:hypothetical protein